jgi:glycosyltransferase involved in cell wall biosynthesis
MLDADHRAVTATAATASPKGAAPPRVGVVLATHNRPRLMRRALASILEQSYAADIEVVLVFDRSAPDFSLEREGTGRRVRVITNTRTPGLAGARNSGILALDTDLVGFCDDDDVWLPGKLEAQVSRLLAHPQAQFCTTAMRVDCDGRSTVRTALKDRVTLADMARSRMAMLHSSSFLFRRAAMVDGFGLVDETLPRSMAEDWDLLLRAARQAPIENVDEPLVAILWGASSYFNDAWLDKNEAHSWLIDHHPEILQDPVGAGLLYGKLAFGHAVLGQRRLAVTFALRSLHARWREPRGYLALAVAAGGSGQWIQESLNRRGHGI